MENDNSNIGEYFNCYNEIKGYYLDKNDSLFKKCYDTCETCEIKGDNIIHNCLKCKTNFSIEFKINNYSNCYENCSYYYYFDNESYFHCTINFSCPNEYPILLKDKNECIKIKANNYMTSEIIYNLYTTSVLLKEEISSINNQINESVEIEQTETIKIIFNFDNILQDILAKYIKNETKNVMTKEEEINYYNEVIKKVESIFTDINFDTSNIDNGNEQIIKTQKIMITLTTTQNQKDEFNNGNNNMTILDIGNCEKDLRDYYNISDDKKIYMKKMDIMQEGMKIPKIEYDVYCKLNNTNLIKLNISVYKNSQVSFSIPIEISENVDKLNSSSDYFNDICYTSTSDSGTDISLEDRKKVFINENKIICQEDCYFSEYNSNTKKVKCSCDVKQSSISFANMTINKTKLSYIYIKKYIKII